LKIKLHSGAAWAKFQQMVAAQGGDVTALERMESVHYAPVIQELKADHSGQITEMDARRIGQAVLELGAGRSRASDPVDFAVGVDRMVKVGTEICAGQVLLRIHARMEAAAATAALLIKQGIQIV
jgi:thymidine phosphorylase